MFTEIIIKLSKMEDVVKKTDDIINKLPQPEQEFLHAAIRLAASVGTIFGVFIGTILSILIWVVL